MLDLRNMDAATELDEGARSGDQINTIVIRCLVAVGTIGGAIAACTLFIYFRKETEEIRESHWSNAAEVLKLDEEELEH